MERGIVMIALDWMPLYAKNVSNLILPSKVYQRGTAFLHESMQTQRPILAWKRDCLRLKTMRGIDYWKKFREGS